MKRTTKQERRKNVKQFYTSFMSGTLDRTCVIVKRNKGNRCQFTAVSGVLQGSPIIIAESKFGIEGCFIEFFDNIKGISQKTYYEDGFKDWVIDNFGFDITYFDGQVFIWEKTTKC